MSVEIDTENGEVLKRRALRRSGDSVVVSIPPEVLAQAGAHEGDEITVAVPFEGSTIELRKDEKEE